jgi:hypothetical protein
MWHKRQLKFLSACLVPIMGLLAWAEPVIEKLDGIDSVYSGWLIQTLHHWPAAQSETENPSPVSLTCIATAKQDSYVGMLQRTTIHADFVAVLNVFDDLPHYKDLFPGTVDVHTVPGSRDGNRFVTHWEQRVPILLLPNITYELAYAVDKSMPERGVYRYKLRRGGLISASDGMVVVEAAGPETTHVTAYDFFNAHWGPLPAKAIWLESLRNGFLSHAAIKLKAENPDWSYARIAAEAERLLAFESERIERCYSDRKFAAAYENLEHAPRAPH